MKTIVTGGAGFIGSHLVERLLDDGHAVLVLDNLSTGRLSNLEAVKNHPNLTVMKKDIADFQAIRKLFADIDWVFHLAALADIVPSIQNPLTYHHSNVDGTISVLQAAHEAGVKRFLYAASSSCYGIPAEFPTPESAAIQPMYPYALTKNLAEQYVMHWGQVYGLPCISLRLFNVFGPRARTAGTYGAVFGVFLAQKLAHKPFTVVGDGTQTRDFTFVTDVANAFIAAVESPLINQIFNVGSGNTYSINYLVELLGGEVAYLPRRPGEPDTTFADITKIKDYLGWMPRVRFENGVKVMLAEISHWRDAPVWNKTSIAEATQDWFTYLGSKHAA